jgi:hypothetical protein
MTTPAPTVADHDDFERQWQCEGCTRNSWPMQHAADAASLNAYGITFAILSDGPYEELAAFRDFMGYTTPWYSNANLDDPTVSPLFGLLDRTVYGRREEWEDSPEGWPQLPTHSFLRTDEHGAPMGPRSGGRPVPQWTRPGVTGVGAQTG